MTTDSTLSTVPAATDAGQHGPVSPAEVRRGLIGLVVAASLAAGPVAAGVLVLAPVGPATESAVTGSLLCGLALGWLMLAVLSVWFTDQPQRWAYIPALVLGLGGLLLLVFGSSVQPILEWVGPPVLLALAVWMAVRVHHSLRSRLARWLVYPVIAMLALASVAGGYQTVGAAVDAQANPMPGQLIDVGGHRLHLQCTGTGAPTVVLEAGGGGTASDLGLVTSAVARDTRICVYDRSGRGWSDAAQPTPHGARMAVDLHTLLRRAHVPGPYVLAGHSFGGLYVQIYAARYPGEVAGMILIDSTAPDAAAAATPVPYVGQRLIALAAASTRLGLARIAGRSPEDLHSAIDEYANAGQAVKQAASLTSLGDKPLVVLTAGIGHDAAWSAAQNRMAELSTNSSHRIVDGANHGALVADRDGAAATTHAILDVVSSARDASPLRGDVPLSE